MAHSILFKLAREFRDYIYEYSFCGPRYDVTKHGGIPEPALLLTCKIVRDEAIPLFYGGDKRLRLVVNSYDPAVLVLWNMKFAQLARVHAFRPAKVDLRHIGIRNWDNLKWALQLHSAKKISPLNGAPPGSPRYTDERFFIKGLFQVVEEMKDRPWEAVEAVLDMLRPGLVKLHRDWRL